MTCEPRFSTPRTDRPSYGPEAVKVAAHLGWDLLPWQRHVLDVALEHEEDGSLAYREVIVTTGRQQGKSAQLFALMVWRAAVASRRFSRVLAERGRPDTEQRVAFSAQTGHDARKKMLRDWVPILEASEMYGLVERIYRAAGSEAVQFNGGRIEVMNTASGSGHGQVTDLGIIDEAFDDADDRREQALMPAMNTRVSPQLWVVSTAGTDTSHYLRRKVEVGRVAAKEGRSEDVAFFEWSAEPDADPADPATWASCMPALGLTVPPAAIRTAQSTMAPEEFSRAYLNLWTEVHEAAIPMQAWESCLDRELEVAGDWEKRTPWVGVDISPDLDRAALAWSDTDGVEVVDTFAGTEPLAERCAELSRRYRARFVIQANGPASAVRSALEQRVSVEAVDDRTFDTYCMGFYDAVLGGRVAVRPDRDLDNAVAGARRVWRGDRFRWGRRSVTVDMSPLVAASLAHGHAAAHPPLKWLVY